MIEKLNKFYKSVRDVFRWPVVFFFIIILNGFKYWEDNPTGVLFTDYPYLELNGAILLVMSAVYIGKLLDIIYYRKTKHIKRRTNIQKFY